MSYTGSETVVADGVLDIVVEGETGLMVPPRDGAKLAAAVGAMIGAMSGATSLQADRRRRR